MKHNTFHITALDLIVETSLNHQKLDEALPYLEKLCLEYDLFYSSNIFITTLREKIILYKNIILNDEETLFILHAHIPYLIKEEILILEEDKFNAYVIILYWVKNFNLPHAEIYFKLAASLELNLHLAKQAEDFIFNNDKLAHSSNYLCIKPNIENQLEKLEGNWIESNKPEEILAEEFFSSTEIKHNLFALFLPKRKAFLLKCDIKNSGLIKNQKSHPDSFCVLQLGDNICLDDTTEISFVELKKKLIEKLYSNKFILTAEKAECQYNKQKGLKPFNIVAFPGQLIGIIGTEGAGKSTLLRMLAGVQHPTSGSVFINSYNLFQNKYQLSGIIGYVPEEDLLFNELTAFENIEFAARLHLEKENKNERNKLIVELLEELELLDIRDKRVGSIEEKNIQSGQRRLLNIGLELIRKPQILIVDNSKSGLSLSDASHVIDIILKYTFKGTLIITSITQTGEGSFNNFDNLFVLNKNGYPYYYGTRLDLLNSLSEIIPKGIYKEYSYLKYFTSVEILKLIDENEKKSLKEYQTINYVEKTIYELYLNNTDKKIVDIKKKNKLPGINTSPPRLEQQYITFTIRNFIIKWARKKELAFTILAAPILAAVLAIVMRNSPNENYTFIANNNIPNYFFLSIIVNIFLGLSQSAREIISEKYIIQKEERINLSLFSYINSKITFLLIILFIQSLFYTLIGNTILEINGMLFFHWIIYFSCGASGVFLGLVFSSSHNSYESLLLKTIPISIIIAILLGGGWISLDKIKSNKNKYPPLTADLMISRWAYEAIMVNQFSANNYEKIFFEVDKTISTSAFNTYQILPLLNNYIHYINKNYINKPDTSSQLLIAIKTRFDFYSKTEDIFPYEYSTELTLERYSTIIFEETNEYLNYLNYYFYNKYSTGIDKKTTISDSLSNKYGHKYLNKLEQINSNQAITQIVRNTNTHKSFKLNSGELIQLSDIIFQHPTSDIGRAQMFSSLKKFNGQQLETFEFNLSIIWIINLLVYVLLITNIPQKILKVFHQLLIENRSKHFNK